MELFSLVVSTTELQKVRDWQNALVAELRNEAPEIPRRALEFHVESVESGFVVHCRGVLPYFQLAPMGGPLYRLTGQAVADYIVDQDERKWLGKLVQRECRYYNAEEWKEIEDYCYRISRQQSKSVHYRDILKLKRDIAARAEDYLQEYTWMNVDGFVEFRLPGYLRQLRDTVHDAVDEFILDQQYKEFISALKYFVDVQECKMPVVHVIHHGGNYFQLLNEQMHLVDPLDLDAFTVEGIDHESQYEDMIVSALINVSPHKIYIHTRKPDEQVIKTITQIFEGRTLLCTYCPACRDWFNDPLSGKPSEWRS